MDVHVGADMRRKPSFWEVTTNRDQTGNRTKGTAFASMSFDMRGLLEEFYLTVDGEEVRFQDLTNQILSGIDFSACNDGMALYAGSDLYRSYYPWATRPDGAEDSQIHYRGVIMP